MAYVSLWMIQIAAVPQQSALAVTAAVAVLQSIAAVMVVPKQKVAAAVDIVVSDTVAVVAVALWIVHIAVGTVLLHCMILFAAVAVALWIQYMIVATVIQYTAIVPQWMIEVFVDAGSQKSLMILTAAAAVPLIPSSVVAVEVES